MTTALFGGSMLASFLAGTVALFAPCCISVMLPAYFASSFASRRALIAMTFVFAAGISLVILPVALGAGSCCAPVLAGVAALAGVSGSYPAALTLGVAYVFGMVFPLFLIALLWDKFDWSESRLLRGRRFSLVAFGRTLSVHSTALVSGLILVGMGGAVIWIATRGNSMPSSGWQVALSAHLQHYAHLVTTWAKTVPGWITGLAVVAALVALAWKALRQVADAPAEPEESRALRVTDNPTRLQEELQ